jgi:tetratricopeptide (TPR) repeat protein
MKRQSGSQFSAMSAVTGIAGILLGVIVGYIIGAGQTPAGAVGAGAPAPAVAATGGADPHVHLVNEEELKAYRDILARDPKNVKAAIDLGNRLYDAGRYAEAIPYYEQALAIDPRNVGVSTDLGTAMYYAGRTDDALAQLDRSLAIDPAHGQTLFNIGIIRREGKKDAEGAVKAWERLLAANPSYPDAAKVQSLIADARR